MSDDLHPSNFVCHRCGNCCRINGIVRLSETEVDRIAVYLGLDVSTFVETYARLAADRHSLVLLDHDDGSCVMLDAAGQCCVDAVKPDQCRSFPFAWMNDDSATICPGLRRS